MNQHEYDLVFEISIKYHRSPYLICCKTNMLNSCLPMNMYTTLLMHRMQNNCVCKLMSIQDENYNPLHLELNWHGVSNY